MLRPNARSPSITSQESYAAVMITDLVADVPVNIEPGHESTKPTKEAINLAYNLDGTTKTPEDGIETVRSHKTNGGSISRGVILNAVQFGQPDSKTKSDEKAIHLQTTLPVPSISQQISEPKGFKDMSFLRKIAFGFSFLPSVLFVLCFSVILPCNVPKPCVEEVWVKTFNHTEATSRLEIPQNLVFTALKESENFLIELQKDNGLEEETIKLATNSVFLKCGKIRNADKTDCIVMDEDGKFYGFRDSYSEVIWNPIADNEQPSTPVILPDCNGDMIDEVAMAVSNTKIKIMYSGDKVATFIIANCDSVPTKLMPWATNGSDLVFVCDKQGKDTLVRVPQNVWCAYSKNSEENIVLLHSGALDSLKKSIIQPLEDGLVLWSGDEIFMIQPDGFHLWNVSNVTHSEKNRYILYGNFNGENKQVALLGNNFSSGLKVTLLDPTSGTIIKSNDYDFEATEVTTVHGKKRDFILILQKVRNPTDIVTTALTQINDFSSTIVNLVSNEEVNAVTQYSTSEELSFLDAEGNFKTLKELTDLKDAAYKTTITVVYDEKTDVLHIYLLSTSDNNETIKTTKVRNINVANWDKSAKSKCLTK